MQPGARPKPGYRQAGSAAVCGMHYTGMAAVTMIPGNGQAAGATGFSPEIMAVLIFGVTSVLLVFLLIINVNQVADHHGEDTVVFE